MAKRLNLGCGHDTKPGWVNVDRVKLPGVDLVWDLETLPLPFRDGEFEEVVCFDVLEHLEYIPVLEEIFRIMKPGGILRVRVPHFTSKNSYTDPTHRKLFAFRTFDFFAQGSLKEREYYFEFSFARVRSIQITFEGSSRLFFFNRLVAAIVNSSRRMQYLYESTALARLFPAENILVELEK